MARVATRSCQRKWGLPSLGDAKFDEATWRDDRQRSVAVAFRGTTRREVRDSGLDEFGHVNHAGRANGRFLRRARLPRPHHQQLSRAILPGAPRPMSRWRCGARLSLHISWPNRLGRRAARRSADFQSISIGRNLRGLREDFGLRWQPASPEWSAGGSEAATPLFGCGRSFQSGLALRFPPQSKRVWSRLRRVVLSARVALGNLSLARRASAGCKPWDTAESNSALRFRCGEHQ